MASEYLQVIEACTSISSLTQYQNKLNKILFATEDPLLNKLLAPVVGNLNDAFKKVTSSAVASKKTQLNVNVEPYKPLLYYCARCMKAKPQWQIIAEQHGWGPKKAN